MSRLLLLGHRGARAVHTIPENTIASFDRALADGADGFEFDVRLTEDGEAVVAHDEKVDGYTVARSTAKQVSQLPRLRDVLQRYRDSFLDIELKVKGLRASAARSVPAAQAAQGIRGLVVYSERVEDAARGGRKPARWG